MGEWDAGHHRWVGFAGALATILPACIASDGLLLYQIMPACATSSSPYACTVPSRLYRPISLLTCTA